MGKVKKLKEQSPQPKPQEKPVQDQAKKGRKSTDKDAL